MSWKMEVETGKDSWSSNALRFATAAEAERAGDELLSRWTVPLSSRATETPDEPVTHMFPLGAVRPSPISECVDEDEDDSHEPYRSPWVTKFGYVNDCDGESVCRMDCTSGKRADTSALLIAAAPELLAALHRLADYVQTTFENPQNFTSSVVMDARAVIAKATTSKP